MLPPRYRDPGLWTKHRIGSSEYFITADGRHGVRNGPRAHINAGAFKTVLPPGTLSYLSLWGT